MYPVCKSYTHTLNSIPNKTLGLEIQHETFKLHWELHYKFLQQR